MENKSQIIQDVSTKLKENIKIFYTQLKKGCSRKYCYNIYCSKGNSNKYNNLDFNFTEKDYAFEAIKLSKEKDADRFICMHSKFSEIEANILEYDKEEIKKENFPLNGELRIPIYRVNLDYERLRKFYNDLDFTIELRRVNSFFKDMLPKCEFANRTRWVLYIYVKYLVALSINPGFCYNDSIWTDFNEFFQTFDDLRKKDDSYLDIFADIKKDQIQDIIYNYQSFLTLLIFHIKESNGNSGLTVLISFMKVFELIYQINEKYNLVNYREFYNESVNNILNIREQCKTYFKSLIKKDKVRFSLLTYYWLFDPAAKSDVLRLYNFGQQRNELFNSINDMMGNLNNLLNMGSMYFIMEVRRNNLIEDTLNKISNPEINFKKQLRVKFVDEQGIDEGGVKKEFFMLLVRQLFDTAYGMFTYNEENRFFWINQFSFEPKIKFELIGILLGLALFNNVILDIKFPLVIYKKLLKMKTSLEDLKEIDPELYNNFKYLLNTKEDNLKEKLSTTFVAIADHFGEKIETPLKEGGENIYIDETNREEYVDLYLDWYFNKSIENFFEPFKTGFYRVGGDSLFFVIIVNLDA